ncbi:hypothetical protein HJ588_06880 [Flexivirga sp. ID2601S]|uniref:Uncharacterized protein n=1 Tax=Flexivirga aerilata TaxID=1656889 RepID=A0A849AES5_9MICO|nr:hypothetical protein [Flexivirga aerilata]NNG38995.1 hypothetical protein [Flexivirga aerilata]
MTDGTTTPKLTASRGLTAPRITGWWGDIWTAAVLLGALAVFCGYAVHAGLPAASLLRLVVALVLLQWLPGILLWRSVRPRAGWLIEDLACGFAAGFAVSVPAQVIGGYADSALVSAGLPVAITVALLAVPATRRRIVHAEWSPSPWWLPLVMGFAALGAVRGLRTYFRQNRLDWPAPSGLPHVDQYFQIAMTNELRFRGPANWPMIVDESFDYHWFTHAWMGQLSSVAGVPAAEVVLRFAPAVLPVVAVGAIAALALRVTGSALAATIAVLVAMWSNYINLWHTTGNAGPITPESPTLAPSLIVLLALVSLVAIRVRGERGIGSAVGVVALAVVAAGAKGSATPLVVAGLALAVVAALLWSRRDVRPLITDFVLVTAGLLVSMKVIFNGSTDGLALNPREAVQRSWPISAIGGSQSTWLLVAGGLFMVVWGLSKAGLGVALLLRPDRELGRRDPMVWVILGGAIAGAFGPALFVQPGLSQNYFRIQAIPLAAVLSGAGLYVWLRGRPAVQIAAAAVAAVAAGVLAWRLPVALVTIHPHRPSGPFMVILIGLLICAAAGVLVALLDRRQRIMTACVVGAGALVLTGVVSLVQSLRDTDIPPSRPGSAARAGAVTQGELDAATFIGNHSAPDDLVMTNRHCTTIRPVRGVCESRRYVVAAYSGRQMLVEGWGYAPTITAKYVEGRTSITAPFFDPALLALNDSFYTAPTSHAARALWDEGVRWVYVDKRTSPSVDLRPFATEMYQNSTASAWKLTRP